MQTCAYPHCHRPARLTGYCGQHSRPQQTEDDDYPVCLIAWCTELGEADGLCLDHHWDSKENAA